MRLDGRVFRIPQIRCRASSVSWAAHTGVSPKYPKLMPGFVIVFELVLNTIEKGISLVHPGG